VKAKTPTMEKEHYLNYRKTLTIIETRPRDVGW